MASGSTIVMHPATVGAKPRSPEKLIKGKAYPIQLFIKQFSKYKSDDGKDVVKLVAIYEDFKIKFYTYMPKEYDEKPDEEVAKLNAIIKGGKQLRIVYYGKVGHSNIVDILYPNDVVNTEKLQEIRFIQEQDSGNQSPAKQSSSKRSFDSNESGSPVKRSKSE